ncbi:hypothetical protein D3C78_629610 [compost metagenome]
MRDEDLLRNDMANIQALYNVFDPGSRQGRFHRNVSTACLKHGQYGSYHLFRSINHHCNMIPGNNASILQQSAQPIRSTIQLCVCRAAFVMNNRDPIRYPFSGFFKKTVQHLRFIILSICIVKSV